MFKSLVDNITKNSSDENLSVLVSYAQENNLTNQEIAYLANKLASSGTIIKTEGITADIPSTGGPTSLSTLLCPLILSEFDIKVVKLGVPGRPAGGIDTLAQIPDYQINFAKNEIEKIISYSYNKYIHFIADKNFTPLDKILFDYRKKKDKIGIAPLVIASLLSKKIACGLSHTGLDIRISSFGNFGKTFKEAQNNAEKFKEVGEILGISIKCFLSDSNYAYQPYIGRGESLIALKKIFDSDLENEHLLKKHLDYCLLMSCTLAEKTIKDYDNKNLKKSFIKNLVLQGSSESRFENLITKILNRKSFFLRATSDGFLQYNLELIRSKMTQIQNMLVTEDQLFPDPFGIVLLKDHGSYVIKGEELVQVRYDQELTNENDLQELLMDIYTTNGILYEGRNFIIENYGQIQLL